MCPDHRPRPFKMSGLNISGLALTGKARRGPGMTRYDVRTRELDCGGVHIGITFMYIITPVVTPTHRPVLARDTSSLSNFQLKKTQVMQSCFRIRAFSGI